jgi:hypothetical protein
MAFDARVEQQTGGGQYAETIRAISLCCYGVRKLLKNIQGNDKS